MVHYESILGISVLTGDEVCLCSFREFSMKIKTLSDGVERVFIFYILLESGL